jgi:alkylation response protein AidB-like acyl-CoA dehydrogenase
MIKGLVPKALGGGGGTLVQSAILVEEMYAADPSASLTIFATGLGLMPVVLSMLSAPKEQKEAVQKKYAKFLEPFLKQEGAPLASLVFSEPDGVANWLEKGAKGLKTVAVKEGDEWVISGDKVCRLLPFIFHGP